MAADDEAEAAAAEGAGGGAIGLFEALEEVGEACGGNTDPGVADAEGEFAGAVGLSTGGDVDGDGAAVGELDGVGEEIDENLAEAGDVADDGFGRAGGEGGADRDFLFGGAGDEEADGRGDACGERERDGLKGELAGRDFGEVEDVVDDGEEVFAAGLDDIDAVALLGGERGIAQEGGHADDGVHGRADFVTHGREKLGLGAGGLFGGAAGDIEVAAGFVEVGDDGVLAGDDPAEFEGVEDVAPKGGEGVELVGGELTGYAIDDAEGAEGPAVVSHEGSAGVETDVRRAGDEGVGGEAGGGAGVRDDEDVGLRFGDGVGAEGEFARGFGGVEADAGFEPLAVGVDEGDQGDGNLADLGREAGEVVVVGLGRCIQNAEGAKGGDAGDVVGGNRWAGHTAGGGAVRVVAGPTRGEAGPDGNVGAGRGKRP